MKRMFILVLGVGALGGCVEAHLDDGIVLVNETSETFVVRDDTLGPGRKLTYHVLECRDDAVSLVTTAGVEYARLDEEYCPGQTWTITGPGEVVLADD